MRQLLLLFSILLISCSQPLKSPPVENNFSKLTSPDEILEFVQKASEKSTSLDFEVFGTSVEGRDLIVVKSKSPKKSNLLRVLIFAQQHGNEQSGKEACLLLIQDLANRKVTPFGDNIELWIIPQMNPDGGILDQRRNANGVDLNRDHVTLTQQENKALHNLFHQFMPHVTVDIHEYYPYQESWAEFGGFKNFDVQVGIPTNLNVSAELKAYGLDKVLPAIESHLYDRGFSFQNYIVGPAPNLGRTRHSTVDIDDGRQSFAILNTLSIIYEGLNGKDSSIDNLEFRAKGQYEAIKGLLNFLKNNSQEVINLVESARNDIVTKVSGDSVAIRMEHFSDGNPLEVTLLSSKTGRDTMVTIENYHPVVKSTLQVARPKAYLVPESDSLLVSFLASHSVAFKEYESNTEDVIVSYQIESISISVDEELENRLPHVSNKHIPNDMLVGSYLLVQTNQLHSNFLVTLLEPQSMLGLAQRAGFEYLLKENEPFPILRIE